MTPVAAIVQLPFPSQTDPLPELTSYYDAYQQRMRRELPEYELGDGDLWEMPLWVAHLDGAIGRDDTILVDLSRTPCSTDDCVEALLKSCPADAVLLFSPLAQNFDLARQVSHAMQSHGFRTVLGGNMTLLASVDDFTWIVPDKFRGDTYDWILSQPPGVAARRPKVAGPIQQTLDYRPRYRLLSGFSQRVPMLRINASHGCLFACTFCGDAWSRELHTVPAKDLQAELIELREMYPEIRLIYIGDKTFGQSADAVTALTKALKDHPDLRLIVQTHIMMVKKPRVIEALSELPIVAAELGFETGSVSMLSSVVKGRRSADDVTATLRTLAALGVKPVLNVLGGLPEETSQTYEATLDFLSESADLVWLFNIYNFVPYPLTPLFPVLRPRIHDWNFANWREDRPVVFEPYNQSVGESWGQFRSLVEVCSEIVSGERM